MLKAFLTKKESEKCTSMLIFGPQILIKACSQDKPQVSSVWQTPHTTEMSKNCLTFHYWCLSEKRNNMAKCHKMPSVPWCHCSTTFSSEATAASVCQIFMLEDLLFYVILKSGECSQLGQTRPSTCTWLTQASKKTESVTLIHDSENTQSTRSLAHPPILANSGRKWSAVYFFNNVFFYFIIF